MAHRTIGQLGFVDGLVSNVGRLSGGSLDRVNALVDWAGFEAQLAGLYPSRTGEKAFPPVMMLKVLLLQCWHALSDPEMEAALDDRISFRRFAGLSLEDAVPDHSTIWRFRQRLSERQLDRRLLAEVEHQLDEANLIMKRGTLVDASLVTSAARRPRMDEGPASPVDKDARFGSNNERRRFMFGYKIHVAVDEGPALVRTAELTPANIQEIDMAMGLVRGDERTVFGDRGYDSKRLYDHLATLGIADGIMKRAARNRPLSPDAVNRNHAISAVRRTVEKVFGTLKRHYRLDRMRYFTQSRNRVRVLLSLIAYNLRRASVITAQ